MKNKYCVKTAMFFSVTDQVVAENLTKKEAISKCDELKAGESDMYVDYFWTKMK